MEILPIIILFITLLFVTKRSKPTKVVVKYPVEYDRGHPFSCKYLEDK